MSAYTRRLKKKAKKAKNPTKEQVKLLKKMERQEQLIDDLVEKEGKNIECGWYPDDCTYCRNCHFSWMDLLP